VLLDGYEDNENNTHIDIILVPWLAFTQEGKRLGRGGGWYDRVIATWRSRSPDILIVWVCFSQQCIDFLPSEAHDQNMDRVIVV
jgi:5-formyltetrahydrofolate cyclo-ligase